MDRLSKKKHEVRYISKVTLLLNGGRLKVEPGNIVILGDDDREQGVRVDLLEKNGSVVRYINDAQVEAIAQEWEQVGRHRRAALKRAAADNLRTSRKEKGNG